MLARVRRAHWVVFLFSLEGCATTGSASYDSLRSDVLGDYRTYEELKALHASHFAANITPRGR